MTDASAALQYGVAVLSVLVTGYFAVAMWRRRAEPTARPLLAVAVVAVLGAIAHAVTAHPNPVERGLVALVWADAGLPLWSASAVAVVLLSGGFWFLFALQYTGRGGRLVPLTAAGIGVFWLALFGTAALGDVSPPPGARVQTAPEVAGLFGMFLMTVLMIVGALLVVTTALRRNAVRFREALALAGGGSVLAFTPFVATTVLEPVTVPVMLSMAGSLFLGAVGRYPMFEAPPVARIAGRDQLIEELDDPFLVVDLDGRIRDLNPAGEHYFEVDRADVLGDPIDSVLPASLDPAAVATSEDPVQLRTPTGATLAVTADRVTDARDRSFGHLLVCRDVTERQRRESRLGVLNQLLTGAVSERMEQVADEVDPLATTDGPGATASPDPSAVGRRIRSETTALLDLVARAREIERALATEETGAVAVSPVVEAVVASAGDGIEPAVERPVPPAAIDADLLETVLELVVADPRDTGPAVAGVSVAGTPRGPTVRVLEDTPGDIRTETGDGDPSRSDLPVELARLAVQHVGGDVSVRRSDAGERQVVIDLPGVDEAAAERDPAGDPGTGIDRGGDRL